MAKKARAAKRSVDFELILSGRLADEGQIELSDLGAALQGWHTLVQLAFFTSETTKLELPPPGTAYRLELRVTALHEGSLILNVVAWLGSHAAQGLVGNRFDAACVHAFKWLQDIVSSFLTLRRAKPETTIDDVTTTVERAAKSHGIRIAKDREVSVLYSQAIHAALQNATVPLDSSAGQALLRMSGADLEIEIDEGGRALIRAPLAEPVIDATVGEIIEGDVKFVRINKKTLHGLMNFVHPQDESQVSQQRFVCTDKTMRKRANVYTRAFHEDTPLTIRAQLMAYEAAAGWHGFWIGRVPGRATRRATGYAALHVLLSLLLLPPRCQWEKVWTQTTARRTTGSRRAGSPCHDQWKSSESIDSVPARIPAYHRADDHFQSVGFSTRPRLTGFWWMYSISRASSLPSRIFRSNPPPGCQNRSLPSLVRMDSSGTGHIVPRASLL